MMGTWWSEEPSGFKCLGATRIHLEHLIRRRLLEIPNVQMRAGASVTSYLTDQSGASVHGLEYTDKFTGQALNLSADLIVDCTGRHSRTLQWLEQQGCGEIPQEEIDIDVCYTSQFLKLPESPKWKAIYIGAAPPSISRMALIIKVESDLYCLGIVGYFGDFPPRDSEGIKKFLESLASPELAELYPQMIPVTEQLRYRFKSNLRRYFSRAPRLPEGLLFAGDVACSFDPVYAQGMSAATISAETIDDCLRRRRNLEGLSREYHSKQDAILNDPWMAAVSSDFRFPNVEGQRTLPIRFIMSYTALLLQAMRVPWVHDKVVPIFHLLKRPMVFFHPYLIAAALMVKLGIIRPDESRPSLLGKNQKSAARRHPEKKMEAEASL